MKSIIFVSIFLSCVFTLPGQTPNRTAVNLGFGTPVSIDGKIDENEWKDAAGYALTGGGRIFFKHDGAFLYIAFRGGKAGFAQVYLREGESSDVSVVHASAALGRSVYSIGTNKAWQPDHGFIAEIRDKTINPESQKKLDEYLAHNNWVANNTFMGTPGEIEFKIKSADHVKKYYVGAVYVVDSVNPQFFPETLADDCTKNKRLVEGWMPADVKFDFNQWSVINIERKAKN